MTFVSDTRYKQRAVVEFLVAEKESVGTFTNGRVLCMEVVQSMGAQLDAGFRELRLQEVGKRSCMMTSWVPRSLTTKHRRQRKAICSELLEHFDAEAEAFLSRIVTGDETWAHHYEPESKRQSMEWRHPQSPKKKKFKTTASAGKVMITVFWDIDGAILVDMTARGETINSDAYIKISQ